MFFVGLFRDIDPSMIDESAPSLSEALWGLSPDEAVAVEAYLTSIGPKFACPGVTVDPIDKTTMIGGAQNIRTDGVWIWRDDLIYYVKKYHILLPKEFLDHIKTNKIVSISMDDLTEKGDSLWAAYEYAGKHPSTRVDRPTVCPDS